MAQHRMYCHQPYPSAERKNYRCWIAAGKTGIFSADFSSQTQALNHIHQSVVTAPLSVTYLTQHPKHPVLYAVLRGEGFGQIHAYGLAKGGELSLLNQIDVPAGAAHCSIDCEGKFLLVAYYTSGKAGIYPLDDSGHLSGTRHEIHFTGHSLHPGRQTSPHPHWIGCNPKNDAVYITDLGRDEISVYQRHPISGKLLCQQQISVAPGSGPRHIAFHPSLDIVYVTHELRPGISRYRCDTRTGKLYIQETQYIQEKSCIQEKLCIQEILDSLTGQKHVTGQTCSEEMYNASDLTIHPSGRFLYVLNRGVAVISVFSIHQKTGELKLMASEPAYTPSCRNITLTPDGQWMFVTGEFSNSVVIFRVNQKTGELAWLPPIVEVPNAMLTLIGLADE
ncbi:6-phosphogluconolactonase [Vibrio aerogenes CECT 7868]|uniref:6-phosphogluconolactonase n=1 Tax=Vibrio aerogenes CECT 7868 TaxID=1216006 RepID=A0A1M6DP14_9VIBR|nr:beta-propeller fold lactonase family protein [Vibrio aerogenes]SHI75004.1 6-phosphogluconolactonase [Vibrio aerogenes CECT 7868]